MNKPEPEECGAWTKIKLAGKISGERGVVTWSAPYDDNRLMAIGVCPAGSVDGVGRLGDAFFKVIHPVDLNIELDALSKLVGFDWKDALRIAQGI